MGNVQELTADNKKKAHGTKEVKESQEREIGRDRLARNLCVLGSIISRLPRRLLTTLRACSGGKTEAEQGRENKRKKKKKNKRVSIREGSSQTLQVSLRR